MVETVVIIMAALFVGLTGGILIGTLSRLFFRYSFKEFVKNQYDEAQEKLNQQVEDVQHRIDKMIATANAEVAGIYRNAAAAKSGGESPFYNVEEMN